MELSPFRGALLPLEQKASPPAGFRLAAVLLGLSHWWGRDARLFAIRRSHKLRDHAGQVGFPGGKMEAQDQSLAHTALRESHEEIGLNPSRVKLLGQLSAVPTPSLFWIVPFVGLLDTVGWVPSIDSGEVDELLVLRRNALENPANYVQRGAIVRASLSFPRHEYQICEPPIWGASAHMVHELLSRWRGISAPLAKGG